MQSVLRRVSVLAAGLLALFAASVVFAQPSTVPASAPAGPPRFELMLDASVCDQPYTGRVYVMTASRRGRDPIHGPGWFNPEPFFALDVKDWKPGDVLVFDASRARGFPAPLSELSAGPRFAQAVIDRNGWTHRVTDAPGNVHSEVVSFTHDPASPPRVRLVLNQRVPEPRLEDTEEVKFEKVRSRLLSEFHQRDVFLQAAVGLPEDYADERERRYPVMYVIPGFGGTIQAGPFMARMDPFSQHGLEVIRVYLDPDCPTGHNVFADSANNGPVGTALVEELIPYLEKKYRMIADTGARYVMGHSSGGWASLWLQVAYPDVFGGVWSLAPDPVDFRAFQWTNVYDPTDNQYYERDGSLRPASRPLPMGTLYAKTFCDMEEVLGRGGQMQSFEAVFSPRGPDGRPAQLWDRVTGKLNPQVAEHWKRYDIRLKLANEWKTLGPKLAGKLHVFCGDADMFFLERAVYRLRDQLKELGSDAYVEIVAGADHGLNAAVYDAVGRQVAEQFAKWQSGQAAAPP